MALLVANGLTVSHHRVIMVGPRILAALAWLDKLRYWVAVPLGASAGIWLGWHIAQPGIESGDGIMAAFALALALWLGVSSPRPVLASPKGSRP